MPPITYRLIFISLIPSLFIQLLLVELEVMCANILTKIKKLSGLVLTKLAWNNGVAGQNLENRGGRQLELCGNQATLL